MKRIALTTILALAVAAPASAATAPASWGHSNPDSYKYSDPSSRAGSKQPNPTRYGRAGKRPDPRCGSGCRSAF